MLAKAELADIIRRYFASVGTAKGLPNKNVPHDNERHSCVTLRS
jgi:hypothetical protein